METALGLSSPDPWGQFLQPQTPRRARATFPTARCVSRSPAPALQGAWLLSDSASLLSRARF